MLGDMILYLSVFAFVVVVLFLIFREAVCWYWKINERLELMKSIDSSLRALAARSPLSLATATAGAGAQVDTSNGAQSTELTNAAVAAPEVVTGLSKDAVLATVATGGEQRDQARPCPHCGKSVNAGATKCGHCWKAITS